jgi:carboxypeptidase C (cathepsin A)
MSEHRVSDDASNQDSNPEPSDDLVTTDHILNTPSGELRYRATSGRVVLKEEGFEGETYLGNKAKAEMFITSYIVESADPQKRPITFAFNGGPGSSSVWLHLGLLGPRRVVMGDADSPLPPPWGLADNAETILAQTDLVFIDPVTTGYSRVVEGGKTAEYHGFQRDLESVGALIRLLTTRYGRWLSPKFLAGESYGTLRASALADHLQTRYGWFANGIILISSVIDMGTIRFTEGNDQPTALYLPTYAALAHYHGLHGDRSLDEVRAEAEALAERDYPWALARGSRLSEAERQEIIRKVASVTGLKEDYVRRVDLRIEHQRFFREILRERGQIIGRLDGRFLGYDPTDGDDKPTYDPSNIAIHGPYSAAFNHYVREELNYESDLPYEILTNRVQPWSYAEFEGRAVSISSMLGEAMRHNPELRVHVACGFYDGATPYYAAEHAFAHLQIPDHLRDNIEMCYYPAGHMMYVHEPSRQRQCADLASFISRN